MKELKLEILKTDKQKDLELLRVKCEDLTKEEIQKSLVKISDDDKIIEIPLEDLAEAIFDIMYKNHGIGFTASHTRIIGHENNIQKRIVVIDLKAKWNSDGELESRGKKPIIMINPKIVEHSDETFVLEGGEGSLSIPNGKKFLVNRFKNIKVEYFDLDGEKQTIKTDYQKNKLLTVCIQHEIDQVNGIVVCDAGKEIL